MSRPSLAGLGHTADVAVVGGGPAGAAAALHLARAGVRVTLLERAALPRYKTCGGGVVARGLGELPNGLDLPMEGVCQRLEARFPLAATTVAVERSSPLVWMAMRADLDRALVEAARAAGARIWERAALTALRAESDGVRLETSAGPLAARLVVGADGAVGPTARLAGWSAPVPGIPALELELPVPPTVLARFAGTARFDMGTPPGGYGWVFPKRAHLSVGVASMGRGAARLRESLARYVEAAGLGGLRGGEVHGYLVPLAPRREGLVRGRVLLAGDAAGLADPLTGEGISCALRSGRLAALALVAGELDPEAVAVGYQARLRAAMLGELAIARLLARVLYGHPRVVRWLVTRAGALAGRALAEVFAGERTYRSLVRRPRSYLRLLSAALRPAP